MDNDDFGGLNFWPAFTDSMLAIVLILLLVIGAFYILVSQENQNIAVARTCQSELASGLGERYKKVEQKQSGLVPLHIEVRDEAVGKTAVIFEQDSQDKLLLHISFMDFVLFDPGKSDLKQDGVPILKVVGERIKNQLDSIVEIQIKGHADTRPPDKTRWPDGNLQLASARANRVFLFLQTQIDPVTHAMSTSSYGHFFPVGRKAGQPFTAADLEKMNRTDEQMQTNRRIELLLFYGGSMKSCVATTSTP
jgi:outer membrane protein OmpA-like peptidoglycan-associated protein